MVSIIQIDPVQAEPLIRDLDAYQDSLYPSESNHLDSVDTLQKPNVHMVGAFEKRLLCGIGAVKIFDTYGEIKRVYVPIKHRGKGLAKKIMAVLEQILKNKQITRARLETGVRQPEAIGLYRSLGYKNRRPFGDYQPDKLSVFMEKRL